SRIGRRRGMNRTMQSARAVTAPKNEAARPSGGSKNDLAFLATVPLFQDIPRHDLKFVSRLLQRVSYPAGTVIFEKDSLTADLVIIETGNVSVFIRQADQMVQLASLGPGAYFGEMAVFDDYPRSASAMAITDVNAFLVGKDAFRAFITF